MATAKKEGFDFLAWLKGAGGIIVTIVLASITLIYGLKSTVDRHEAQFVEVGKQFEKFNATLNRNYDDYAKNQKEETATREKMRESFQALFQGLVVNSERTKTQVESIGESLKNVTSKIDNIQLRQLGPDTMRTKR